jgi:hypothetical protein
MEPVNTATRQIVLDAARRFRHWPTLTIAKYLLHSYGDMFDGNLELIRDRVRYARGEKESRGVFTPNPILPIGKMKMPHTWREKNEPYKLPPGLWLVLPDIHIPFHEQRPIESAIKYGQDNGVTGVLLEGDMQDCSAVSFWPATKRPHFDREIEMVIDFLDFLQYEFPSQKIVYKFGNHEYRLPRYYASKAPELIGVPLRAMDSVLGLESRGIDVVDYRQKVMAGKLPIYHGHEMRFSSPVNPARGLFLKILSWGACAHFHRTSENTQTNDRGEILTTWSFGCLCNLSPDYATYGNNWNWGFSMVNVEKNGDFEVRNHRILNNGKVV